MPIMGAGMHAMPSPEYLAARLGPRTTVTAHHDARARPRLLWFFRRRLDDEWLASSSLMPLRARAADASSANANGRPNSLHGSFDAPELCEALHLGVAAPRQRVRAEYRDEHVSRGGGGGEKITRRGGGRRRPARGPSCGPFI